jgi:deoxyhypusine synthase
VTRHLVRARLVLTAATDRHANKIWLGLAVLLIATGINAVVREGLVVAVVLGAAAVGLIAAVLLPGAIAGWFVASHAKSTAAEIEAAEKRRLEQAR